MVLSVVGHYDNDDQAMNADDAITCTLRQCSRKQIKILDSGAVFVLRCACSLSFTGASPHRVWTVYSESEVFDDTSMASGFSDLSRMELGEVCESPTTEVSQDGEGGNVRMREQPSDPLSPVTSRPPDKDLGEYLVYRSSLMSL